MTPARTSAAIWLVAAGVGLGVSGCKNNKSTAGGGTRAEPHDAAPAALPERVVLLSVAIKAVDPAHKREIYPRLLAQSAGRILGASDYFYSPTDEVPPAYTPREATLDVVITYDVLSEPGSKVASIMAAIEAELVWNDAGDDPRVTEKVIMERTLTSSMRSNVDGLVAEHISLAVEAAAAGVVIKEEVRSGPDEKMSAALASTTDLDLVMWALSLIRERKLKRFYSGVIPLLGAESRDVREAAVGALIGIGDRRAVGVMADKTKTDDAGYLLVVIDAIATLGGPDALTYLEFVADHPDERVQKRAAEGLERLKRGDSRER